jgi:hypothetical protein
MAAGLAGRTTLINVDIFTDGYRVSGQVAVGSGGIHSNLGDPNTDYLEIEGAYISRINHPGDIIAHYPYCAFRKESITFILLQDRREGLPVGTSRSRSIYSRGRAVEAFLTVPNFEISGEVLHEGKLSPTILLAQSVSRYQFVYNAVAAASLYPDVTFQGDLLLVDENRIGIFCLKSVD